MTTDTHHHTQPEAAPAPEVAPASPTSGQAIAALVLGILSLTMTGLLTGIPAVILGIIDIKKHPHNKGMALAGLITGGIGTLTSLMALIFFIAIVFFGLTLGGSTPSHQYPSLYNTPSSRV